jgi:hypothetical protein
MNSRDYGATIMSKPISHPGTIGAFPHSVHLEDNDDGAEHSEPDAFKRAEQWATEHPEGV